MSILIPLILIVICCLIIWRVSDGFEAASQYLGRNLSEGVRGATINAIGSSMPELFTTLWFLFVLADKDGFSGGIGTTAGSSIFNGMIIPAVVILAVIGYGLAKRVDVSKRVILRDGIALIIAEFCLVMVISNNILQWWHGLFLMVIYVIYVVAMLKMMPSKEEENEDEEEEEDSEDEEGSPHLLTSLFTLDFEPVFIRNGFHTGNAWALLMATMAVMGAACALLVYSCEALGEGLGIPIYFIAVILASAATSVPDTILSYKDAMQGNYDDAVANALGSNIFDICFALGFPLFLYTMIYGPIEMSVETIQNISELWVLLLFMTIAAFFIYYLGEGMGRLKAGMLLGMYFLFTLYILGSAMGNPFCEQIGDVLRALVFR